MKTITLMAMLCLGSMAIAQNSETMTTDHISIQEKVTRLFVATDARKWEDLTAVFDASVGLDYSSMTGQPGSIVTPAQIIEQWSAVLPGFEFTHHQLGNFLTDIDGETAHTFCYGTATHYLENDKGNLWTVVGTYDFDLKKSNGKWTITSMRFNYKYQTGNGDLVGQAIENAKEK